MLVDFIDTDKDGTIDQNEVRAALAPSNKKSVAVEAAA
jgi:hypothetical protein